MKLHPGASGRAGGQRGEEEGRDEEPRDFGSRSCTGHMCPAEEPGQRKPWPGRE